MTDKNETFESIFRKRFGRDPTVEDMQALIDQSSTDTKSVEQVPRDLGQANKQGLLRNISEDRVVSVICPAGDEEAFGLACQIWKFLSECGYPMQDPAPSRWAGGEPLEQGVAVDLGHPDKAEIRVGPR